MLNLNLLCYWTMQMYPYIITPIDSCAIINIEKGQTFYQHINSRTFIYLKKGEAKCEFEKYDSDKRKDYDISSSILLFFSDKGVLKISSLEEETILMVVSFSLFAVSQPDAEDQSKIENIKMPLQMRKLYVEIPEFIKLDFGFTECKLLDQICDEIGSHTPGNQLKMQNLLSQLIIELVRNYPPIPNFIDAIAISSNTDNDKILEDGRIIWISDVEIWCNDPNSKNSYILRTMRAEKYFVGNSPGIVGKISFRTETDSLINQPLIGRMQAIGDSTYIVLLWADKGVKPLNISQYANKYIYLKTKIKSNKIGSLGLALYSTSNRHWFGKSVSVDIIDEWKDFVIPIMQVQSQGNTSSIIDNTIQYIHRNYSSKIILKDVAESVYANPNYLSTIFSKETGMTFTSYVKKYRLSVSQKLLLETNKSIEEIALNVGFYDIQHFSKIFKKEFGISPGSFREINLSKKSSKSNK